MPRLHRRGDEFGAHDVQFRRGDQQLVDQDGFSLLRSPATVAGEFDARDRQRVEQLAGGALMEFPGEIGSGCAAEARELRDHFKLA